MGSAVHNVGSSIGGALGLGYAEDDPRNPDYGTPGHPGYVAPPPDPTPPPPPPPPPPAPVAAPPPVSPVPGGAPVQPLPDPQAQLRMQADAAAKQRTRRGRASTMSSPTGLLGSQKTGSADASVSTLLG